MAGAAGYFSDEQFREACAELQQPALAGADWQLLVEASGITIYRLLDQVAADPPAGGDQGPEYPPRSGLPTDLAAVLCGSDQAPLSYFALCRFYVIGRLSELSLRSFLLLDFVDCYILCFTLSRLQKHQTTLEQGIVFNGPWLETGRCAKGTWFRVPTFIMRGYTAYNTWFRYGAGMVCLWAFGSV